MSRGILYGRGRRRRGDLRIGGTDRQAARSLAARRAADYTPATMRIYDGSPRQDFEEVFRSIGAYLDRQGMREILLAEAPDGFIVQGLMMVSGGSRSDTMGQQIKETLTFLDDDISQFMDEAIARRGTTVSAPASVQGYYERALRVLGRYMDEQRPRDVFLFEQDGSYVLRLLMTTQAGTRHELSEFTKDDVEGLIAAAAVDRRPDAAAKTGSARR